jgi:hypothetical protein
MKLTINKLREEAISFCKRESNILHDDLIGVSDGKAVGTYIEHKFEEYLKNKYEVTVGSSAKGIDLPDSHINTDIKVTSIKKPQNSSPFKNIEQKIYGLGYNLLIFIYEKTDINDECYLDFKHCIFLEAERSGDYTLTKMLRKMIDLGAKEEDITEILEDNNVPGDEGALKSLAKRILEKPPQQGYLTISNAFQWRLRYNNTINLDKYISGIYTYEEFNEKELGDYQTPLYFTDIICKYLRNELNISSSDIIIEPTCGIGNFLKSIAKFFTYNQLYGIDIDNAKLDKVDKTIPNLKLINADIFTFKFENIDKNNSFLIIGNLPGITNAELSKINSKNLPTKSKFRNEMSIDARMRKNNFDISEYIILKIIDEFKDTTSTIAFLCKTTIPRNVFIELDRNNIEYSFIKQLNFNSFESFNIDADTCLFIIQFGGTPLKNKTCEVADISNPSEILHKFGFKEDKFYLDMDNIQDIDGKCQMEWRLGVKHSCAGVMELICENNQLKNKNGENVSIENNLIYPLLKSGDLKKPIINETSKYVIITQQKIRQDTSYIETEAPKTWQYLNDNKKYFEKRNNSLYKNTPDFSIFGIGDYIFKKYKVAISGFYKKPIFSLVYSEKPLILDDTSYFLSFDNYDYAYITMLILNSPLVKKFLKNIAFIDSKRPYSKKVLKRIDILKCLKILSFNDLKEVESQLELNDYLTNDKLEAYISHFKN